MELTPGSTLTVRTRGGSVSKLDVPPAGTHRYTHLRYAVESGDIAVLNVESGDEPVEVDEPDEGEDEGEDEAQTSDEPAPDLDELRAEYEQLAGQKPNHRWKSPRLQREIAALHADEE